MYSYQISTNREGTSKVFMKSKSESGKIFVCFLYEQELLEGESKIQAVERLNEITSREQYWKENSKRILY